MGAPEFNSQHENFVEPENLHRQSMDEYASNKWRSRINAAVISIEVSPINEVGRFGALAVAMTASGSNPVISAVAIGGVAALFEVPAAVFAADALVNSEGLQRSLQKVDDFTSGLKKKFGIDPETKTSIPTKMGLAYFGGSAVSEMIKHKEEPTRSLEENRRYGLGVAGSLIGISAVQGYLIAGGIQHPSPDKIAGVTLAIGTIVGAGKALKGWVKKENHRKNDDKIGYVITKEEDEL